jgi:response regulator of citrate/malate metabolism
MTAKKILIAEDELLERHKEFVQEGLHSLGIEGTVATADKAEESMAKAKTENYDLILHDNYFANSKATGADYYFQANNYTRSKTVFITGNAQELKQQITQKMPGEDPRILEKPVRKRQIWQIMQEYLT